MTRIGRDLYSINQSASAFVSIRDSGSLARVMSQPASEPTQPTPTTTTEENGETQKSFPAELTHPIEVLMIDNFDSFTYNLYQYISLLGVSVTVIRNDAIRPEDFSKLNIKYLIISPGPGHPLTDAGISQDAIRYFLGRVPVFGVCMGLECLVDVFGGDIG